MQKIIQRQNREFRNDATFKYPFSYWPKNNYIDANSEMRLRSIIRINIYRQRAIHRKTYIHYGKTKICTCMEGNWMDIYITKNITETRISYNMLFLKYTNTYMRADRARVITHTCDLGKSIL